MNKSEIQFEGSIALIEITNNKYNVVMKQAEKKLTVKESLTLLPDLPGVYLMQDKNAQIIYIGKAKNLKKRVKSYFSKTPDSAKLSVMIPQINSIDFIITDTEVEALILESHLVKKHKPKYNVLLKDDKKFPWFLITDEEYPRILIVRKADKKALKGKYYGPYTNTRAMYSTLEMIKRMFPLKQCKNPKFRDRPCIYYQMGKCLGVCQRLVPPEEYRETVKQVEMFLSGRQTALLNELNKQMEFFAKKQAYEKAARLRDSYFDVLKAVGSQKVISENTDINQDIIGVAINSSTTAVSVLKIREGRLIAKEDFEISLNKTDSADEALIMFMQEYYQLVEKDELPKEIIFPLETPQEEDTAILEEWLSLKKGTKLALSRISAIAQTHGKKLELVQMANKNASAFLEGVVISQISALQNDWNDTGSYIQEKLMLENFPHRVECFDISHIQGVHTVASMSVFIDGKPCKSEYRKYKIRTLEEGQTDDFAAMREVIKRRGKVLIKQEQGNDTDNFDKKHPMPDLIIIDGGKGQLSSALEAMEEVGIANIPIVSLAKKQEEIFTLQQAKPIIMPADSKALFFFQRIRDEAHRFAVSYHRSLRSKNAVKSLLDDIPSLKISHKTILIEHFGDINGIMKANKAELSRVVGKYWGGKVYSFLHNSQKKL